MLLKKYRIWVLLGITLVFVYFAPPGEATSSVDDDWGRESQKSLSFQKSEESRRSTALIEINVLRTRASTLEENEGLDIFSAVAINSVSDRKAELLVLNDNVLSQEVDEVREQAPPTLPFKILGKYINGGDEVIFVQHENQNLVLRLGDTFLEKYKLESIDAGSLVFTYLPMNVKQTLSFTR